MRPVVTAAAGALAPPEPLPLVPPDPSAPPEPPDPAEPEPPLAPEPPAPPVAPVPAPVALLPAPELAELGPAEPDPAADTVVLVVDDGIVETLVVLVVNRGRIGSSHAIPSLSASRPWGSGGRAVKLTAGSRSGQLTSGAGGMQKSG